MEDHRRPDRDRPHDLHRGHAGPDEAGGELNAGALSHSATALCAAPAATAWRFLQDGAALGRWALGSLHTTEVAPGVVRGVSMFDGSTVLIRPVAHEATLGVDYHVGNDLERLVPRIAARVTPGPAVGRGEDQCLVTLTAWRDAAMDEARWARLVACHEVEVLLIQSQLPSWAPG